jgi:hypothetical protein
MTPDPDDELLSAWLSGDLAPEEGARLASRLASEPALAQRLQQMQALLRELDALPLPAVPERLVRRAAGAPRLQLPLRSLALLAAGGLLGFAAGRWRPEGGEVELLGQVRVEVDGRAAVAVGPGLEVVVHSGHATVTGIEAAPIELSERRRLRVPLPAAPAPSLSLPSLGQDEALQQELQIARGQLATHQGEALPWPPGLPEVLGPAEFPEAASRALAEGDWAQLPGFELLEIDCAEYPCAAVVHARPRTGEAPLWDELLAPLAEGVGPGYVARSLVRVLDGPEGAEVFVVAGVLAEDDIEQVGTRLLYRARALVESHE